MPEPHSESKPLTERAEPHLIDLAAELRRTVGLFDGAMPVTPKAAWEEAIERVRLLATGRCNACMVKEDWHG